MRPGILILAVFTLIPLATHAQELESIAGVRLTFDDAGARALAMGSTGGANPAAIAGAPRSFTLESRRRTMEGRYIRDESLDTIGVDSSTSSISAASFVVPLRSTTWSFAYDEPLNIEHSTVPALANARTGALYASNNRLTAIPGEIDAALIFLLPATLPIDASLRLQRYSGSGAWTHGPLAVGAAVRYERFRQRTEIRNLRDPERQTGNEGLAERIDDDDVTYAMGATWKLTPTALVRASYQSGGAFTGVRSFASDFPGDSIEFHTPASLRAGVTVDVRPNLTLAADAVRVGYSTMMHSRRSVFAQDADLGYPDVTELHAGAEYRVRGIALRGGWWRDPAHALSSRNGVIAPLPMSYLIAVVDDSENHMTAGIGFGGRTRFDASIDRGSRTTRAAVGVTTTF